MTEGIIAATVGVGGAVLVAITSSITQWRITRNVIDAERNKISEQIFRETEARGLEKRHDRLVESVSDLLAAADPQITPGGDYSTTVRHIHRIQLVLNRQNKDELKLHNAISQLGQQVQGLMLVIDRRDNDEGSKLRAETDVLHAHSDVIEAAKLVLKTDQPT